MIVIIQCVLKAFYRLCLVMLTSHHICRKNGCPILLTVSFSFHMHMHSHMLKDRDCSFGSNLVCISKHKLTNFGVD